MESEYINNEVTLKELILKIKEYWKEVWTNWKLLIFIPIPLILLFFYQAITTPTKYPSKLTFMLNDEGGGNSSVSALLGQFGFGGGQKGEFNISKMIELSKSRKVVSMVLFEKVKVEDKKDYIANHFIREYNLHKKWSKNEKLRDFYFSHHNIDSFDLTENTALKSLHSFIVAEDNGIFSLSNSKESGILTMVFNTIVEELSYESSMIMYSKLGKYYIDESVGKQNETYKLLKNRTDSLERVLNGKQLQLLKFQDNNRGLSLRQYEMNQLKLEGEIQKILVTYSETYKNLQVQDFALRSETPVISILDTPIYPISSTSKSSVKAILTGGFLGIILAIIFITVRKFFRDLLEN